MQRISLVAGFVLAFALTACAKQEAPQAPPPVEVGALAVHAGDLQLALEYAAQLRGAREVEVRARVSGILLQRLYQEGSRVKQDALLFRIDPAPFRAEAARATAEVGVQQANLQQARRELDRIAPLYEQRLVSLRDRDSAIAAFETAEAALAAARAELRTAELSLSYTDVRAPIAGLTGREARSEGSLVTAGSDSSLLTHIVQADQLYVEFGMPQSEAESLRAAVKELKDAVGVQLLDPHGAPLGAVAKVEYIAPSVGDDTGTVSVRGVLDNENGALLPGQVVRARVEGVRLSNAFVIPKRAVMHGMQGPFVWVVDTANKVTPRPVKLGTSSGNNVIVTNGLVARERVVVDGILKVQPGALVKALPLRLDGESAQATPPTVKADP